MLAQAEAGRRRGGAGCNFHAIKPVIDFGTEEQKRRLLPRIADGGYAALAITEPTAGSDATC